MKVLLADGATLWCCDGCERPHGYKNERGWARIFESLWCRACVARFLGSRP